MIVRPTRKEQADAATAKVAVHLREAGRNVEVRQTKDSYYPNDLKIDGEVVDVMAKTDHSLNFYLSFRLPHVGYHRIGHTRTFADHGKGFDYGKIVTFLSEGIDAYKEARAEQDRRNKRDVEESQRSQMVAARVKTAVGELPHGFSIEETQGWDGDKVRITGMDKTPLTYEQAVAFVQFLHDLKVERRY